MLLICKLRLDRWNRDSTADLVAAPYFENVSFSQQAIAKSSVLVHCIQANDPAQELEYYSDS